MKNKVRERAIEGALSRMREQHRSKEVGCPKKFDEGEQKRNSE